MSYDVNTPKYSQNGTLIAISCNKIVKINNRDFYEIDCISIQKNNLALEFGEEWRAYDMAWKDIINFIILTTKDFDDIQIYYCKKSIPNKIYKQGYYYVPADKVKNIQEIHK